MALHDIPVLSTDYPVFDWDAYPNSLDALVQDGLVSNFPKETWNAIVQVLEDALNDAGLSWDSKYTSASEAKITKSHGALYADMVNSVRHNIDHPASLGWAWANNNSFRGYIGREDFKGYSKYGENSDYVYPEYIIELVRKLNLLIELMRYTAKISSIEVNYSSLSSNDVTSFSRPSIPINYEFLCNTLTEIGLFSRKSIPSFVEALSNTLIDKTPLASSGSLSVITNNAISRSQYLFSPYIPTNSIFVPNKTLIKSSYGISCISGKITDTEVEAIKESKTYCKNELNDSFSVLAEAEGVSHTFTNVGASYTPPLLMEFQESSKSSADAEVLSQETEFVNVETIAKTKSSIGFGGTISDDSQPDTPPGSQGTITPPPSTLVLVIANSKTPHSFQPDSWDLPTFSLGDGVLWIRQSYDSVLTNNVLEVS